MVLFAGQDTSGNPDLWVTDGTSAGTSELAVAGADSGGLFDLSFFSSGFSPGFTVLGTRVLFEGYDASGIDSLWVTDGTSAGTRELTVAGSFANGVFFDVNAPDLTVFAGRRYSSARTRTAISACGSPTRRAPGTSELTVGGSNTNRLFFNATEPLRICEYAIASPAQCVMQSLSVPDAWRRFAAARPPRATFSKTNDQKILVDPFH
jgi:ELWxxDGT repeat protein